jgi:hypothetical protein
MDGMEDIPVARSLAIALIANNQVTAPPRVSGNHTHGIAIPDDGASIVILK